jgi:hypothetical protein
MMTRSKRVCFLVAFAGFFVFPLAGSAEVMQRYMKDGVLISVDEPTLAIAVDDSFTFVGRHPITIGAVAAGERFVFIDAAGDIGRRFFVVQFEGFLPGVDDYYRYDLSGNPVVANYAFRSNGYAFDMSKEMEANPTKESASTHAFLRSKGFSVPDQWMMWRSLTVADEAKKKEVILFYVEDVESIGLTLDSLYQDDSATQEWINVQEELEVRANSSFRLAELNEGDQPIASTWSSIPNNFMR